MTLPPQILPIQEFKKPKSKLSLGIIGLTAEERKTANRELLIFDLVKEYLGTHTGMQDELTLWTAFKRKEPVILKSTGEKVYIHKIENLVECETNKVQTRYTIKHSNETEEFQREYTSGLTICQQGELEEIYYD